MGISMGKCGKGAIPDAVLFDLDGTLIDSTEAYFMIMEIAFQRIGVPPVSRKRILNAVVDGAFLWDEVLPATDQEEKDALITKAWGIIREIYPQIFRDQAGLFPGAGDILKDLKAGGVKIGIATSTPRDQLEVKLFPLRESGVDQLLDAVIAADDTQRRKPAADPLLECVRQMGAAPDRSVYVGDTRADIRAGKAAGMATIGVLSGIDPYETLKMEEPDLIIKGIVELRDTDYFPKVTGKSNPTE
ncbi:MAG: HAD family hydrolase [Deltaproteobacteria bacterium]|nr:HAD family hydrolase [Deltaproteobacteria bacterium]MBW2136159.1 HAD family hydrolase [Deltaproteobacteria bacterium]